MLKKMLGLFAVVLLAGAVICIVGCGGGGDTSSIVQFRLVDAPTNADEINVAITRLDVNESTTGWTTVVEYETPMVVNLLDYRVGGASKLLSDSPLPPGHYTMIRMFLESAQIVIDGVPYDVDLGNVEQTGIKCNGPFTVGEGELMVVMLDFNTDRSFVNNPKGSDNYKLHPVMTMSPQNVAAQVTGTVEFRDATEVVQAVPENAAVEVYPVGMLGVEGELLASGAIQPDGTFQIDLLPEGTYDLRIVEISADGLTVTALPTTTVITGVSITAPSTDLGTIVVQPYP